MSDHQYVVDLNRAIEASSRQIRDLKKQNAALQAELETVKGENGRLLENEKCYQTAYDAGVTWKARAEAAEAQLAKREAVEATGWIVGNGTALRWRCWKDGMPDWTTDKDQATRYARRIDAEEACREDDEAWIVVQHGDTHPAPTHEDGSGKVTEAAQRLLKMREGIMSDVSSAHSNRGNGASEWMREDDRDFRKDLREAFDALEAALRGDAS